MTNREWLNTLSDKGLAEFIESFGQECVYCPLDKTCDGACVVRITDWLSQPHETTADEDFAEIDYEYADESVREIVYHSMKRDRFIYVQPNNIYFSNSEKEPNLPITEIKAIEKIADKKRKEVWGK